MSGCFPIRCIGTVLLGVGTLVGCGDDDQRAASEVTRTTAASTTSSPESGGEGGLPDPVALGDLPDVVAIDARPFADWITIASDAAWVANVDEGVARYDLATGERIGSTPTGTEICLAMDAAHGSLWLGDCATTSLVRVDLASGQVQATIPLPVSSITEESSVAAGDGGVFILGDAGATIVRIDPQTNAVAGTLAAPEGASALRAGHGSLWVTSADSKMLTRLEPESGAVQATVAVGGGARFLAVSEEAIWVMNNADGTVTRVDPLTNTLVATIPVAGSPIDGGDIAAVGGAVWARVSDALAARIDPSTNTVVARLGPAQGSGSIAATEESVWISAHDTNRVWSVPHP